MYLLLEKLQKLPLLRSYYLLQVTSHRIVPTSLFSNKCPAPAANLPDELILWVGRYVLTTSILPHMKTYTFTHMDTQHEMLLLMTNAVP